MFDANLQGESTDENFERQRMECIRRLCNGCKLHVPDGWELIPDGETVLNGDARISKSREGEPNDPYPCFESVGMKVGNQSKTANDDNAQGGYWFIRKIVNDMPMEERMRNPHLEWLAARRENEMEARFRYEDEEFARRRAEGTTVSR
jgi:hypothetical protein